MPVQTRMHSIRHHPASVGTQIRQFGRGATGHGSEQDAAHSGGSARGYLADLSLISVSAVMGVHGRIASVACIFIQSIASYECALMAPLCVKTR
jgi:hypothetical protein